MAFRAKQEKEKLLKKIAEKRAHLESRGDIKIKVPRISLPCDYQRDESLFTLPPELLKPMIASGYPNHRKKVAALKKKGASHLIAQKSR